RPWCMRPVAAIKAIAGGDPDLHGQRFCQRLCLPPSGGGLSMRKLIAFVAGLTFGFGLLLGGMANPAKVLGFLDLAGVWDPSLALVMGAAIAVALLPFSWARRQSSSLLGAPMQLPQKRGLDRRLMF